MFSFASAEFPSKHLHMAVVVQYKLIGTLSRHMHTLHAPAPLYKLVYALVEPGQEKKGMSAVIVFIVQHRSLIYYQYIRG